jgi:hypothetical protein
MCFAETNNLKVQEIFEMSSCHDKKVEERILGSVSIQQATELMPLNRILIRDI